MTKGRFYLTARPTYWQGVGQSIDMFGTKAQEDLIKFRRTGGEALASDWRRVGMRMQIAFKKAKDQTLANR